MPQEGSPESERKSSWTQISFQTNESKVIVALTEVLTLLLVTLPGNAPGSAWGEWTSVLQQGLDVALQAAVLWLFHAIHRFCWMQLQAPCLPLISMHSTHLAAITPSPHSSFWRGAMKWAMCQHCRDIDAYSERTFYCSSLKILVTKSLWGSFPQALFAPHCLAARRGGEAHANTKTTGSTRLLQCWGSFHNH